MVGAKCPLSHHSFQCSRVGFDPAGCMAPMALGAWLLVATYPCAGLGDRRGAGVGGTGLFFDDLAGWLVEYSAATTTDCDMG